MFVITLQYADILNYFVNSVLVKPPGFGVKNASILLMLYAFNNKYKRRVVKELQKNQGLFSTEHK